MPKLTLRYIFQMKNSTCQICNCSFPDNEVVGTDVLRLALQELIKKEFPLWSAESRICTSCLEQYRMKQLQHILEEEKGELTSLDEEVLKSLSDQQVITENSNSTFDQKTTFGDWLSDRMASFGGSWKFLSLFSFFMISWIGFNAFGPKAEGFDPYPYILLNLILSCIAAIQAPIIMMSQNRQESKDRLRSENDYMVNLKAELEIRQLHMKIDQLLKHQWRRLLEIQQLQLEIMNENLKHSKSKT
jgi:uncharacterized membrane protein